MHLKKQQKVILNEMHNHQIIILKEKMFSFYKKFHYIIAKKGK